MPLFEVRGLRGSRVRLFPSEQETIQRGSSGTLGFRIQDARCRVQDSSLEIQDSGFRVPDSGCRMKDAGFVFRY